MRRKRSLSKQIGVLVTPETSEAIETVSRRDEVPKSELVRVMIEQRINELLQQEERLWNEMDNRQIEETLSSLRLYLESKLDLYKTCPHKGLFEIDPDYNFKHTKEFCRELNIMFEPFKGRLEKYYERSFRCDCEIYEMLNTNKNKSDGGKENE